MNIYDEIKKKVGKAFKSSFQSEPEKKATYNSIQEYELTERKRFRIKKAQKARGLTRDEAFQELFLS